MKITKSLIHSYPFTIRPLDESDGGGFAIEYPDLPGCISDGETPEEALRNGGDAVRAYLLSCEKHGDPIPKPGAASGQWRQRVPRADDRPSDPKPRGAAAVLQGGPDPIVHGYVATSTSTRAPSSPLPLEGRGRSASGG